MNETKEKYEIKLYRCSICGQVVAILKKTGSPLICCGEPMKEIIPGTTDAFLEKHVPLFTADGCHATVMVGSTLHPMDKEHYIEWIAIKTCSGYQIKYLQPGQLPVADFNLNGCDQVECVYAFCNLHSLWKGC